MLNTGPHGLSEVLYAFTSAGQQQRLRVRRALGEHRRSTTPRSAWPCCSAGSCRSCSCSALAGSLAAPAAGPGDRGHAAHPPAAVRRDARRRRPHRRRPDLLPGPRARPARGRTASDDHRHRDSHRAPTGARTAASRARSARPARPERCCWTSLPGRAAQARPAGDGAQPGHVRRRGRRGAHHRAGGHRPERLRLVDRGLAVADRGLRQPRRGGGRGPRQGAGRHPAAGQDRDRWRAGCAPTAPRSTCPAPQLHARATGSWSRPARSSPATATSSRASPASTSPRSPASPRRSSGSPAATAARSPAAPRCSPTGSSCRSPPKPGESFIDRMIALVEGAVAAEDAERDRAEHPAGQPDDRLPAGDRRRCSRSPIYSGAAAVRSSCWSRCWSA